MSDTPGQDDPTATLAGEYVLGVLSAEETRDAEARIATDPAFAAEVDFWMVRLRPLSDALAPANPPRALKSRLMGQLFGRSRRPAPLVFWQMLAAVATATALACLVLMVLTVTRDQGVQPRYIAVLEAEQTPSSLLLEIAPDRAAALIRNAALDTSDGAVELWLMAEDKAPVSLGLINAAGETRIAIPESLRSAFDGPVLFAVSLEPPGGSPTGQPSGPIVASGTVQVI